MKSKNAISFYTNIAPHYRQLLWEMLAKDEDLDVKFYFGKSRIGILEMDFSKDVWSGENKKANRLKNVWIFNRVVWQKGVINDVVFREVKKALFLGDVNIVSTWIASLILYFKGAQIYYWHHGFPGKENFLKRTIRTVFNRLADEHFVYSEKAKKTMVEYGFKPESIHLIYNSLDYDKHKNLRDKVIGDKSISKFFNNSDNPVLIFIGRLTVEKKLHLLIKAIAELNRRGMLFNLLIIGDGKMKSSLKELAKKNLIKGNYYFYGACYDECKIGRLLANSDLCVSPGNVGLTAIHSLSFGTPVCTHNNTNNQMPEVEAIIPGKTGIFFKENDVNDLVGQITEWFKNQDSRIQIRSDCYQIIDEKYNPYYQLGVFKRVLLN